MQLQLKLCSLVCGETEYFLLDVDQFVFCRLGLGLGLLSEIKIKQVLEAGKNLKIYRVSQQKVYAFGGLWNKKYEVNIQN